MGTFKLQPIRQFIDLSNLYYSSLTLLVLLLAKIMNDGCVVRPALASSPCLAISLFKTLYLFIAFFLVHYHSLYSPSLKYTCGVLFSAAFYLDYLEFQHNLSIFYKQQILWTVPMTAKYIKWYCSDYNMWCQS